MNNFNNFNVTMKLALWRAGYSVLDTLIIMMRMEANYKLQWGGEYREVHKETFQLLCENLCLITMFNWAATPEGGEYWALIESKLLSSNP